MLPSLRRCQGSRSLAHMQLLIGFRGILQDGGWPEWQDQRHFRLLRRFRLTSRVPNGGDTGRFSNTVTMANTSAGVNMWL